MPRRVIHAGVIEMTGSGRLVYESILQSIIDRENKFDILDEKSNWDKTGNYSIFLTVSEFVEDGKEPTLSLNPEEVLNDDEKKTKTRKRAISNLKRAGYDFG